MGFRSRRLFFSHDELDRAGDDDTIQTHPGSVNEQLLNHGGFGDSEFPWELAIAPDKPSVMYASTNRRRVLKSTDGGDKWFDPRGRRAD